MGRRYVHSRSSEDLRWLKVGPRTVTGAATGAGATTGAGAAAGAGAPV